MTRPLALLAALVTLGACSEPELRVPTPPPAPAERIAVRYPSIEVREVSLPAYAALEEIFLREGQGRLAVAEDLLWADDPTRAITLGLTRALSDVTGSIVAPEPWPFDAYPSMRVDVRVEDLLAEPDGTIRLSGQAFVAPQDGTRGSRALLFDLTETAPVPVTPDGLAVARSRLIADLALLIAREGLR